MAVESASDLAGFFAVDDFAVAASYTPLGSATAVTVNGIFDTETVVVEVEAGVPVLSPDPQLRCATSSLPTAAADGDRLVVSGVTYTVRELRPDGTGVTTIVLQKV